MHIRKFGIRLVQSGRSVVRQRGIYRGPSRPNSPTSQSTTSATSKTNTTPTVSSDTAQEKIKHATACEARAQEMTTEKKFHTFAREFSEGFSPTVPNLVPKTLASMAYQIYFSRNKP